jgi:hypothetical protein
MEESMETARTMSEYPADIFKLIFESAVPRTRQGFLNATFISHVSRRWRNIALGTPNLWSYIEIRASHSSKKAAVFLSRTIERVKAVPTAVTIHEDVDLRDWKLDSYGIEKIPTIEQLCVRIPSTKRVNFQFLDMPFRTPNTSITTFDLAFEDGIPPPWQFAEIVQRFPSLAHLHLRRASHASFESSPGFSHLRSLTLRHFVFNIAEIVIAFPYLKCMELEDTFTIAVSNNDSGPVIFPHLTTLKHKYANFLDMGRLSFPVLTEYSCDRIPNLGFIAAHTSITTLNIELEPISAQLAAVAPQLQHVAIQYSPESFWLIDTGRPPPFPRLRTITILDLDFKLRTEHFEGFVRARCLPRTHPDSTLMENYERLEGFTIVLHRRANQKPMNWVETRRYKEAVKRYQEDDDRHDRYRVCMSWI